MNWIIVDQNKCRVCGTCLFRCPANYRLVDGRIAPSEDGGRCLLCGHCAALCPTEAITHPGLYPEDAEPVRPSTPAHVRVLAELVKWRRSHRRFEEAPVPRERLLRLVDLCRYAPTGANTQTVEVKIFENRERIAALSKATVKHFTGLIETLDREAEAIFARGETLPFTLAREIERHAQYRKLEKALEKGRDPIFHLAPTVVVFHASKKARTPKDDAVIAAHTLTLAAVAEGVGSCYIGLFDRAADESREVLAAASLPGENRVYSTIALGRPKLRFQRTVPRKPLAVTWD
jgi:nitroreductase/NAD-dependent dihydropyrimidine dehydrogenase PreA subunit